MYKTIALVLFAAACVSAKLTARDDIMQNNKGITPMVVGGEDAERGEFPHMVQIKYYDGHMCGGSIIRENYVLTAASCVADARPSTLRLVAGEHSLRENDNTEQYREVAQIIAHPQYDLSDRTSDYDIAIVKVKTPFEFGRVVDKIDLFTERDVPKGGQAQISGWGRLSAGGPISDILQKLTVNIYEDSVCTEAYGDIFTSNMVCAGNKDGEHSVCGGDNGSPLYIEDGDKKLQVGIVSWGNSCANAGQPDAYAEVGAFIDFVRKHVPGV